MSKELTQKFIESLEKLESSNDLEQIVSLFDENSTIGNVTLTENLEGIDAVKEFWSNYRNTFGEISSTFRNIIITDGTAALEWTSKGKNSNGKEIEYEGVSVLEMENEKIVRFFAYFNPAKIGHQLEEAKANAG